MADLNKFESLAKQVLSEIIYEKSRSFDLDFWLITVTWVKISRDLSYLDVFVSAFKNKDELTKSLAKDWFFIQREANKAIKIRRVPKIRFKYDEKWEIQARITSNMDKLDIKNEILWE